MKIRDLNSDDVWDYENGYYWFASPNRINKFLAHYEIYKTICNLPGHIFELGVYKGASLIRLATFRSSLENDFSRKIVGFDAYGKFPTNRLELPDDLSFVDRFESAGGDGLAKTELAEILAGKGFSNIELVEGNVLDTIPHYLQEHPETRVAMLHLDLDVKEPTEFALASLYDRLVPGGVIVVDDYNAVAGATAAVDTFVADRKLRLEKLAFYNVPAVIRKPG